MPKLTPLSFKAPVTQSGDDTAFVQRSENMSARRGVAAKYAKNVSQLQRSHNVLSAFLQRPHGVPTTSLQPPYSVHLKFPQRPYLVGLFKAIRHSI